MSLYGPDGKQIGQPEITNGQIMQTLAMFDQVIRSQNARLDETSKSLIRLGLLVEWYGKLLVDAGIDIREDEFPKWAEDRWEDMRQAAQAEMMKSSVEDKVDLDLDDE